jgi:hypothetical protein
MSNKSNNVQEVILSIHDELKQTSDSSTKECPEYFHDNDRARWLLWLKHYFIPFCIVNGSHEYLFKGTVQGRQLSDLKNEIPDWFQIRETTSNVATYKKFVKDDVQLTRLTQIGEAFRCLLPILEKPVMISDGAGGLVAQLLHPTGRQGFAVANIPTMRALIPGLYVPPAAVFNSWSPEKQAADIAKYNKHWPHVPRDDNEWLARFYDGATTDAECPPAWFDFRESDCIEEVRMTIFRVNRITKEELKAEYESNKLANPLYNLSPQQFVEFNQDPVLILAMSDLYADRDDANKKSIEFIARVHHRAGQAMLKIQGPPRDRVNNLLLKQLYPEALRHLILHNNTLELGDESEVELLIAGHNPIPGESWITYQRTFKDNCVALATMKKLQAIVIEHGDVFMQNYDLDSQEMIDNCEKFTDAEFRALYPTCQRQLSEAKMVTLTINAVRKFPRLQPVLKTLMAMKPSAKNMVAVCDLIDNVETDPATKILKAAEVGKDRSNKSNDKKRKNEETENSSNQNSSNFILQDNGKLSNGKPRCSLSQHSKSNHTNPDCLVQHPGLKKNDENKKRKKNDPPPKDTRKEPTWPPCKYCLSVPALKNNAKWHSDNRCNKNPASPAANLNQIPQSVVQNHQVNASLAPIMAQLALTTSAFTATSKHLKKALGVKTLKKKAETSDEEDEDD